MLRHLDTETRLFLSPAEAATMLGVSRLTIYRLIHNGQLPSVRVGGQYRLPRRALVQRLAETRGGWPIEGRRAMSDRIVPGESHVRTTAKAAKHSQALYAEDDELDPDERQRGFWRERDLGNGVVLVEWVSDPGGQSPKEEESTPPPASPEFVHATGSRPTRPAGRSATGWLRQSQGATGSR
jgi:excisionase family DNA binding protein